MQTHDRPVSLVVHRTPAGIRQGLRFLQSVPPLMHRAHRRWRRSRYTQSQDCHVGESGPVHVADDLRPFWQTRSRNNASVLPLSL